MTMSTSATMSARVHRKVMRAPHKRAHPGKMLHAGKLVHPGKNAHLGKFGKMGHYTHTHVRPPDTCENSNDSGLGPDPVTSPSNTKRLSAGMKMTMSTSATMSARVHRKVMRAPHKRAHPGKMLHAGKLVHPGKNAHLGKFGKMGHYTHTHVRPPDTCENSNDSGLGPDPVT
ncbi:jg17950, partial [Pararge aegeria aegeria]